MNPVIQIFKDIDSLSRSAADLFLETTTQAIKERGHALIAISGGSTPLALFRLLANEPYRSQVNWHAVHIYWADERCVPQDDPGSNHGQARKAFLSQVQIPEDNVHRINSDLEPAQAAREYANTLRDFREPPLDWPRFDLVLLGMGEDGHTASLFPGSEVDVQSLTLAVTAHYQDRPANRVTLTPRVFNTARKIVFLVSGENKAETLARVLDKNNYQPELYPVQRIHPFNGTIIWMLDEAAASKLPMDL